MHNGPSFVAARQPAAGFIKIENIDKGTIAFRRAVKFVNSVNAETVFKRHPNIGAQAVAEYFDNLVVAVIGTFGLGEQITQQFANITKCCCAIAPTFVPKRAGAEFAPNGKRRPAHQRGRQSKHQRIAVVKRQRAIKHVIAFHAHHIHAHMRAAAKNF